MTSQAPKEKVSYMVLDIQNATPAQLKCRLQSTGIRIVNFDSANPVFAVGKEIYKGRKEQLLGTDIIFRKKKLADEEDKIGKKGKTVSAASSSNSPFILVHVETSPTRDFTLVHGPVDDEVSNSVPSQFAEVIGTTTQVVRCLIRKSS